jgi:2,3-bisphosphoglycerate-dependent phosphoglycerate mutase
MSMLYLLRHGQSVWNALNLFTGWVNVPLAPKGIEEALAVGEVLKACPIDRVFTSTLIRAQMTALLALSKHESQRIPLLETEDFFLKSRSKNASSCSFIPITCHWELNERMYGDLQGLNKDDVAKKFGEKQLKIWRRSYDVAPPEGESLKMTSERTIPFFQKVIQPALENGENILVSAHGNSLRSLVMFLEKLTSEEILNVEIPTGNCLMYELKEKTFHKK